MTAKASLLLAFVLVVGCRSAPPEDVTDRRAFAQFAKEAVVAELEATVPTAHDELARAAGWAVFSDGGADVLRMKQGVGFGVAHDNATKEETYLRMRRPEGAGPACRLVLVFADKKTFARFAKDGGAFDGPPPAGVNVYQFFGTELAPTPEVAGTSFVREREMDVRR